MTKPYKPGEYIHCELTDRQIDAMIAHGGFEPNERGDIHEMFIGGYAPESRGDNPTFSFSINGEETGFDIDWVEIPRSIKAKLEPIRRRGAGRPPAAGTQRQARTTITLPPEYKTWLESRGDMSAQIRALIEREMQDSISQ